MKNVELFDYEMFFNKYVDIKARNVALEKNRKQKSWFSKQKWHVLTIDDNGEPYFKFYDYIINDLGVFKFRSEPIPQSEKFKYCFFGKSLRAINTGALRRDFSSDDYKLFGRRNAYRAIDVCDTEVVFVDNKTKSWKKDKKNKRQWQKNIHYKVHNLKFNKYEEGDFYDEHCKKYGYVGDIGETEQCDAEYRPLPIHDLNETEYQQYQVAAEYFERLKKVDLIKKYVDLNNLTQREIGEIVGLSQSAVSEYYRLGKDAFYRPIEANFVIWDMVHGKYDWAQDAKFELLPQEEDEGYDVYDEGPDLTILTKREIEMFNVVEKYYKKLERLEQIYQYANEYPRADISEIAEGTGTTYAIVAKVLRYGYEYISRPSDKNFEIYKKAHYM